MAPETKLLLSLAAGLAVAVWSIAWDLRKGRTRPPIGRSYARSEEPRAFWLALIAVNLIYVALLVGVVTIGLNAAANR
jgi:hypothetical protein